MKTFVVLALLAGANLAVAARRQAMPFKAAPAGRVAADLFRTACPRLRMSRSAVVRSISR